MRRSNFGSSVGRPPTTEEIQARWRQFAGGSTVLPLRPSKDAEPAIVVRRWNNRCVELTSDSLQRGDGTATLWFAALISYVLLLIFVVVIFRSNIDAFLPWGPLAGIPLAYGLGVLIVRRLGQRYQYRGTRVRFDRLRRRVYYAPYSNSASEHLWELDWETVQGVGYAPGRSQTYLYLIGYVRDGDEHRLVKVPVIDSKNVFFFNTWAWLQLFMDGATDLPDPKFESLPQTWRDVVLQSGGEWVIGSLTNPRRRWWFPLTLWIDLAIVLFVIPILALPQLTILAFPEPKFSSENDQLCGFEDGLTDQRHT